MYACAPQHRNIVVLGSTGSIGTQTLDVVRQNPERLSIVGLAVNSSVQQLCDQAVEFGVEHLAVAQAQPMQKREILTQAVASRAKERGKNLNPYIGCGSDAVLELCRMPEVDLVVNALVGAAGLRASYEALRAGKVLALANKESLVVGGDLIMPLVARVDEQRRNAGLAPAHGPAGALMPIDSEHGAIYQCLIGEQAREVARLWVTASGGPFRGRTRDELRDITPAQALAHPTWNMGAKITIDSATMVNKGLEVIEACRLFDVTPDQVQVVLHGAQKATRKCAHHILDYCETLGASGNLAYHEQRQAWILSYHFVVKLNGL